MPLTWPLEVPEGDWIRTLRTTWVEPAYLEPDSSWCLPGGEPASAHGNGGAFGGKLAAEVEVVARRLADEHGRPVRVIATREDVVRRGPKRPPIAAGVAADGSGLIEVVRTDGIVEAIQPRGAADSRFARPTSTVRRPRPRCGAPVGSRRRSCWVHSATARRGR